jgi:PAS domain S-box-containing protein
MLRLLIQNISEIVVVIDQDGIIHFSNPQLEKVLGLCTEDVVGRNIFDFVHPEDSCRARREYVETVRKPGEGVPSVLRIRDATGAWIPLEVIANNQLHDPDIQGVIFTARDLRFRREVEKVIQRANADVEKRVEERTTELAKTNAALRLENQSRRKTERLLEETISLLNATLNSTGDGILVVSRDNKVSGFNQRFLEMWLLHCDSPLGVEDTELLSAVVEQLKDPDEFIAKVRALYSDPAATSFDVLEFKDGRIYERYSQPQRLDDRIVGRVWSFRDVTEARRLEEELRQSQKVEALGKLAGGVAHDFNNLLMLISGYLELVFGDGLSSQQREACEQALAATHRAATLTRQLLAFSRKHPEDPTVTNLNEITSNIQGMLRSVISEFIRLDISLCDDPVPVFVDVQQFELAMVNLAINAHDAMPNGGVLSLVTGREQRPTGTFAVLTVTDSGKGMTREIQSRIFEPFFTTKERGKGTGLGLSTVYGIVQKSAGYIEVESEPGQGTQFRIYLPKTDCAAVERTTVSSLPTPTTGHETILLAEDEVGLRAMTRAYLEGLGYRVLEASDGSDAVKISHKYRGPIDLILTDLIMPVLRGDAVVASIRKQRPRVKALYMSGNPEGHDTAESDEVLLKPFRTSELGTRVRSILDSDMREQKAT